MPIDGYILKGRRELVIASRAQGGGVPGLQRIGHTVVFHQCWIHGKSWKGVSHDGYSDEKWREMTVVMACHGDDLVGLSTRK